MKHPITEIVLGSQLVRQLDVPDELPVYVAEFPSADEVTSAAHDLAKKVFPAGDFGDSRPLVTSRGNRVVLTHPSGHRVRGFFPSGYLDFHDLARAYSGVAGLNSADQGFDLLKSALDDLGLVPAEDMKSLQFGGLSFLKTRGDSVAGDQTATVDVNAIVSAQRTLHGVPWIGPGSEVRALVESGRVVGVERPWRKIANEAARVLIRPLEDVLDEIFDEFGRGTEVESEHFEVEKIEFGYFAEARQVVQRFLQPAYDITFRSTAPMVSGYTRAVAAHNSSIERIGPDPQLGLGRIRRRD